MGLVISSGMEEIQTTEAFASSAPFSQAIQHENTVYVSGTLPIDPETGEVAGDDMEAQTEAVFENISAILEEAGTTLDEVVKATVYVTDMDAFGEMNEVYEQYMSEPYPARGAVEVELASPEYLVEIAVIAAIE